MDNSPNEQSESEHHSSSESSDSEPEAPEKRETIRSELQSMSFADLLKLKSKLGTKVYNEAMFGETSQPTKCPKKNEFKRENKNRPRELTSKKQVPLMGKRKHSTKAETATQLRDPRFDSNCGEYDRKKFKTDYSFISDIRARESTELKEQLRNRELDPEERKKIKLLVQRIDNQNLEEEKNKSREAALATEQADIKVARKEERMPFYNTKRERKARELVQQYIELKEGGKLNKHLEKRRKKNKTRDWKKINFD